MSAILHAAVCSTLLAASASFAEDGVELLKDLQYGSEGGKPLLMHLALPASRAAKPCPVVVLIHGGGWNGGSRDSMLKWALNLAKEGIAGASVEYRLAKDAPFPAQLQDCKCAVRFLRANAENYGLDPDRIGAMGCSAGGHLASMLGLTGGVAEFEGQGGWQEASSEIQAVCDCFGPSDFESWAEAANKVASDQGFRKLYGYDLDDKMLKWCAGFSLKSDRNIQLLFEGKHEERAKWASPVNYVETAKAPPPFFIAHGDKDAWVPLQQSLELADAMDRRGLSVRLFVMLNAGHDESKASREIVDFLKSTLRK